MSYREPLPAGCPPKQAIEVTSPRIVYRHLSGSTPTEEDFDSFFKNTGRERGDPCRARGLSVFADREDPAMADLKRLPGLKNGRIAAVALSSGAGRIQQTGKPSHHTWWPYADYFILFSCEVL